MHHTAGSSVTLPPNYLRVLTSLSEIIEGEALELLRVLEGKDDSGGVVRIKRSYTPAERAEKIRKLRALLEQNRIFFRELGGDPVVYREKQVFDARITKLWTVLHDSRSQRIKGYGPLGKEQKAWIDEQVGQLLKMIDELGRG